MNLPEHQETATLILSLQRIHRELFRSLIKHYRPSHRIIKKLFKIEYEMMVLKSLLDSEYHSIIDTIQFRTLGNIYYSS